MCFAKGIAYCFFTGDDLEMDLFTPQAKFQTTGIYIARNIASKLLVFTDDIANDIFFLFSAYNISNDLFFRQQMSFHKMYYFLRKTLLTAYSFFLNRHFKWLVTFRRQFWKQICLFVLKTIYYLFRTRYCKRCILYCCADDIADDLILYCIRYIRHMPFPFSRRWLCKRLYRRHSRKLPVKAGSWPFSVFSRWQDDLLVSDCQQTITKWP